jgi:nitroreductase
MDIYQERYLIHQKRKRLSLTSNYGSAKFRKYNKKEQKIFFEVLENRVSQRTFNEEPIDITPILKAVETAPSSCGRQGVFVKEITTRNEKDLLSGLLVGGTGWIYRGQSILLLFADKDCYKNPIEKDTMPFLDAGAIIQTVYLACEVMNYGCCYVNPNVRAENEDFFKERFNITDNLIFCGAITIGKYNLKHI